MKFILCLPGNAGLRRPAPRQAHSAPAQAGAALSSFGQTS
jgi:hypothetical protein